MQFLVDVDKRRRDFHAGLYGKCQAVRLSGLMVGVLPQYDNLHLRKRCQPKRREDIVLFRIYRSLLVFVINELPELTVILLLKLRSDDGLPFRRAVHIIHRRQSLTLTPLPRRYSFTSSIVSSL